MTTETWQCECGNINTGDVCTSRFGVRVGCGKPRPSGLSEDEWDALVTVNEMRRAAKMYMSEPRLATAVEWSSWPVNEREQYLAMLRASRAPLVEKLRAVEENHAREMAELKRIHSHEVKSANAHIAEFEAMNADQADALQCEVNIDNAQKKRISELEAANEQGKRQFEAACVSLDELEAQAGKRAPAPAGDGPKLRRLETVRTYSPADVGDDDPGMESDEHGAWISWEDAHEAAREDFRDEMAALRAAHQNAMDTHESDTAVLAKRIAELEKSASWWEEEHGRERTARHSWVAWATELGAIATGPDAEENNRKWLESQLVQSQKPATPAPAVAPGEVTTESLDSWLGAMRTVELLNDGHVAHAVAFACKDIRANLARAEERHRAERERSIQALYMEIIDPQRAEVQRLKAAASQPRRCPADGMSDQELGLSVSSHGTHEERGAKARELFTPVEPAQPERKPKVGDTVWTGYIKNADKGRAGIWSPILAVKIKRVEGECFWTNNPEWSYRHFDELNQVWWWDDPDAKGAE
jgi:hypothetical protein